MKEFFELSLWEISHYWHGYSPSQTDPSKLPLEVEKTLRVLAGGASKGLYFRCTEKSLYYQAFNDQAWAVRSIAEIYQRELKRAYKGDRFKKRFLSSLTMTRIAIAKWCKTTNTPAPEFWFEKDDVLLKKDASELDTVSALSRKGIYKVFPLFATPTEEQENNNQKTDTFVDPSSLDNIEIPSKEKSIKEEISRLARENALTKHKPLQDVKKQFIRYFYAEKHTIKSKAARLFFSGLNELDKIKLVPTYTNKEPKLSEEKAVRTLTEGLREYLSEKDHEWLKGFSLDDH
jgi:hypothetical protein